MLLDLLNQETISINHDNLNWQEAIRVSAQPLLVSGAINKDYVTAMIESVNKFGPYIIIAPKVALPHARPEKGALKMGLSLMVNKPGVSFSEDPEHQVNLFFALSAVDSQSHIKALTELSEVLGDEDGIAALIAANDVTEIQAVLQRYIEK